MISLLNKCSLSLSSSSNSYPKEKFSKFSGVIKFNQSKAIDSLSISFIA